MPQNIAKLDKSQDLILRTLNLVLESYILWRYIKLHKELPMKTKISLFSASLLACGICFSAVTANAASYFETHAAPKPTINKNLKQPKSAKQRIAANQERRNNSSESFLQDYADFKNRMSKEHGLDFGGDVSFMGQRGAPSGHKTAFQTIISPYLTWQTFNNEYGVGTLNMSYNIVRYNGGINGNELGSNIGVVTGINDFGDRSNAFDELNYSYQLGGNWDWLTITAGQFPMYNFDGSTYNSNQQVNFINEALSQNASSTYAIAGVGTYATITPTDEWSFTLGAQDASNIEGISVRTNHLSDENYTTFGSLTYSPTIQNLGTGQYSVLLYNQPAVEEQPETTNGYSFNFSQDLGSKWNVFARLNGVSGHTAEVNQSYVLGAVYLNPLERNPLDQIGFAVAYNKIDEQAVGEPLNNSSEKVLETYWAWGVSKWMTITPDIQFYIDPAQNPKSDYDTVFSLRTTFFF